MKPGKYFFISILVLLTGATGFSQEIRPAILGGVNFQNITGKNQTGGTLENTFLPGFHLGANVLMPITPEIGFQPGIIFSVKGAEFAETPETKYRINYLEVPLNLVYRGAAGNSSVYFGFGPYAAFALGGQVSVAGVEADLKFDNDILLWNPQVIRRFDAGANIFAGYELGAGLFLKINGQLGLTKINPEADFIPGDNRSWKNLGFGISAGFRF
jgi:hypothetical protein